MSILSRLKRKRKISDSEKLDIDKMNSLILLALEYIDHIEFALKEDSNKGKSLGNEVKDYKSILSNYKVALHEEGEKGLYDISNEIEDFIHEKSLNMIDAFYLINTSAHYFLVKRQQTIIQQFEGSYKEILIEQKTPKRVFNKKMKQGVDFFKEDLSSIKKAIARFKNPNNLYKEFIDYINKNIVYESR